MVTVNVLLLRCWCSVFEAAAMSIQVKVSKDSDDEDSVSPYHASTLPDLTHAYGLRTATPRPHLPSICSARRRA